MPPSTLVARPLRSADRGRVLAGHAGQSGLSALWASVLAANRPAVALMRGIGATYAGPAEAGVVRLRAQLAQRQVDVR